MRSSAALSPRSHEARVRSHPGDRTPSTTSTTASHSSERVVIRAGGMRRFVFSVCMFLAVELRDWLLDAGFAAVDFFDGEGEAVGSGTPDDHNRAAVVLRAQLRRAPGY